MKALAILTAIFFLLAITAGIRILWVLAALSEEDK